MPVTLFFVIPSSCLDVGTAKLATGRGLLKEELGLAFGFAIFFPLTTIAKLKYANRLWQTLIPSGIPFTIGRCFQ